MKTWLVVPLDQAREEIQERIGVAEELLARMSDPTFGSDQRSWIDYTFALLERRFSDASVADEFRVAVRPRRSTAYAPAITLVPTPFLPSREGLEYLKSLDARLDLYVRREQESAALTREVRPLSRKVFIVHGHDSVALTEARLYLREIDLEPVVIATETSGGRTVIEQIEHYADVGYAIVLLTPDDVGYRKDHPREKAARARQNVILELGFFFGRLGRERVSALMRGKIEQPSDFKGILYKSMDDAGTWRLAVAHEIAATGITVDFAGIKPHA